MHDETYSDLLILSTRRKVHPIRAKAHASDVQIPVLVHRIVLQFLHLIATRYFKDLRRTVASRSYVPSISAKSYAAYHTLMDKVVYQVDIKNTAYIGVEYCEPIIALTLLVRAHLVRVQVREHIANIVMKLWRWAWPSQLGGSVRVRHG